MRGKRKSHRHQPAIEAVGLYDPRASCEAPWVVELERRYTTYDSLAFIYIKDHQITTWYT